ncbi:cysteine desulfurase family protein [Streptococcus danieliae]|uniref:cysteine desulfurase family protein n=1 Tax=Streptococcus danieliae TaxID=747656 RepID=UPI0021C8AB4F|nr:cysteine desulfurase family protein [Streptococcus danieliae]MCU0082194.1 cysteine desulfurase [Streptococcus danieliae]
MIYLDNAATTKISSKAMAAMMEIMQDHYGNPSSIHGLGRDARKYLRQARESIAKQLEVSTDQIIFTSGGTEANNLALFSYILEHQDQGKHLITSAIEHHSVLEVFHRLEQEYAFEVTYLEPRDGQLAIDDFQAALRDDTILVSMMAANNETGALLPIAQIGKILQEHPAAFHVDAVQWMGKRPFYPKELGVDFATASAHKFHGPKGVGFLYTSQPKLKSLMLGGTQENKHRAGTENLPAIVGMATALEESLENWEDKEEHIRNLRQTLVASLPASVTVNEATNQLPHVLSLVVPQVSKDSLLLQLDLAGIAVSGGSACTAGTLEPSHVIAACYPDHPERNNHSIRISFSDDTSLDDVTTFTQTLKNIIGG